MVRKKINDEQIYINQLEDEVKFLENRLKYQRQLYSDLRSLLVQTDNFIKNHLGIKNIEFETLKEHDE
tara:strand:+ start:528 stop:731 length:204 start_codon:yes stop_codon:yes gene_type:complete